MSNEPAFDARSLQHHPPTRPAHAGRIHLKPANIGRTTSHEVRPCPMTHRSRGVTMLYTQGPGAAFACLQDDCLHHRAIGRKAVVLAPVLRHLTNDGLVRKTDDQGVFVVEVGCRHAQDRNRDRRRQHQRLCRPGLRRRRRDDPQLDLGGGWQHRCRFTTGHTIEQFVADESRLHFC